MVVVDAAQVVWQIVRRGDGAESGDSSESLEHDLQKRIYIQDYLRCIQRGHYSGRGSESNIYSGLND